VHTETESDSGASTGSEQLPLHDEVAATTNTMVAPGAQADRSFCRLPVRQRSNAPTKRSHGWHPAAGEQTCTGIGPWPRRHRAYRDSSQESAPANPRL